MWYKLHFKVHLQRDFWNTDWSEKGLPAMRRLTWKTGASWCNQYCEAYGCGSLISLLEWTTDALGTPPQPLCEQETQLAQHHPWAELPSMQHRHAIVLHFSVWISTKTSSSPSKNTGPEADALMSPWQKTHNYPNRCTMGRTHSLNMSKTRMKGWGN